MNRRPVTILFLCTGNSARSILAEAILSRNGNGRFRAYSAGTQPRGEIHPLTLELLATLGISIRGLRCKGLHEFSGTEAPVMDAVISVCDETTVDPLPALPGSPVIVCWKIPDPARIPRLPMPHDWPQSLDAASPALAIEQTTAMNALFCGMAGELYEQHTGRDFTEPATWSAWHPTDAQRHAVKAHIAATIGRRMAKLLDNGGAPYRPSDEAYVNDDS